MANFLIPYTNPAEYTFDDSKIEIESGIAKLINLTPTNETFYVNYNTDINGNRGLGILTGTAVGEASVSDGKLDLAHTDKRYVNYDAHLNADSQQVGCVRFKITPTYSNAPTTDRWFFCIAKAHNDIKNVIQLRHSNSGAYLRLHVYDKDGNFIVEHLFGQFLPVAGTEYEIEVDWDFTTGATRLFINGTQNGSTCTSTCLRDSNIGLLRIGTDYDAGLYTYSQFKIDDFQVFSTVQHTANYTPESVPETTYADDSPTIYKTSGDGLVNIEEWIAFTEILGDGNEGSVRYQLSDDGSIWLYWNGSIWALAGASDYNTSGDCNAHLLDFDASADKIYVKAFLISDGSQKVELDLNAVGYVINTEPSVYAGTNKNVIYNVATTPFSDCLFSDAEGNITKAEWKEEGGTYVEIFQGAYSTLLEAVQAFNYTPTHSGNKTLYLKITDTYDAANEDTMIVNVNRVTVTINIKDSEGNHLIGAIFTPGDGGASIDSDSPYSYIYLIGTHTATVTKTGFVNLSQSVAITITSTEVNLVMTAKSPLSDLTISVDLPDSIIAGDSINIPCDVDGDLTGYKIRCEIFDNDGENIKLANTAAGGSESQIADMVLIQGRFLIQVAEGQTDDFNPLSFIEIELEDSDGEKYTIYHSQIEIKNQELIWETP